MSLSRSIRHIVYDFRLELLLMAYAFCHAYDHVLKMIIVIWVNRFTLQGTHYALPEYNPR